MFSLYPFCFDVNCMGGTPAIQVKVEMEAQKKF